MPRSFLAAALAATFAGPAAMAQDGHHGQGHAENHDWYEKLKRPGSNASCCTGTINGVSTLSGYAKAVSGKVYAFSLLFNQVRSNAGAHAAQDRIVAALIDRG